MKVDARGEANDSVVTDLIAKGICINCEDAEICKFAGYGDDVAFCEEHRTETAGFNRVVNAMIDHVHT